MNELFRVNPELISKATLVNSLQDNHFATSPVFNLNEFQTFQHLQCKYDILFLLVILANTNAIAGITLPATISSHH